MFKPGSGKQSIKKAEATKFRAMNKWVVSHLPTAKDSVFPLAQKITADLQENRPVNAK